MKNILIPLLLASSGVAAVQLHHRLETRAAATVAVTGRVTDAATGQPLPGVSVVLKGTTLGTSTDAQGQYTLAGVPEAGAVLRFAYVGYVTAERAVGAQRVLNVKLTADVSRLNEVVVTKRTAEPKMARANANVKYSPAADQALYESVLSAPSPVGSAGYALNYPARDEAGAGDTYAKIQENAFHQTAKEPLSTFALDVDNASYSNVRRFLNEGQLPPRDAVRVEEMLNYFRYNLPAPAPASPDPVRISAELSSCPWAPGHQLARVGIQARRIETDKLPPANLVFLVDVSGSMQGPDRLGLVQNGLKLLTKQLRPQDHVALVVYAGAAGLVLPATAGSRQHDILEALDRLEAGGSTAGGAGLRLAYSVARQNFQKDGNNRVILCTDGDFNVGESSEQAMEQLITAQRESGVFLTVLGVGRGNLRDSRMEALADKGNGNYAYLDNLDEARRTLVAQFGGTLFTVAKDVKLQVEFNPARVANYRLIGYENRLLAAEDFNNDRKDAGELGAGHTVTALYEIVPTGSPTPLVDNLKYQSGITSSPQQAITQQEVLTVKLRYKEPQGSASKLLARPLAGVPVAIEQATADQQFAAAVAEFGMLLRQSEQRGAATYAHAIRLAEAGRGPDPDGYRAELVRLLRLAEGLGPANGAVGQR